MLEPVVEIVFDARAADQDWRGVDDDPHEL
jgi:hypothetical protein